MCVNVMPQEAQNTVMATQPIHIGNVIRHARLFNAQRWQEGCFTMDNLLQAVDTLFALLEQRKIAYVLVGGVAILQYIQGRNTEDIDLIVSTTAIKKLPEIEITTQDVYFARGQYLGLQIDFLLTKNPLFSRIKKKHAVKRSFFERDILSATVEGLILLKLYALPSLYRQGNFARVGLYENDVATLMFYHRPDMQQLLDELRPFISDRDAAAIQDIVIELERRVTRFQHQPGAE